LRANQKKRGRLYRCPPSRTDKLMNKEQVYACPEEKFLTYKALAAVPVQDCPAVMIPLSCSTIKFVSLDEHMKPYTGDNVYVREGILPRLITAQEFLSERMPDFFLEVFYGYRHLNIQIEKFEKYRKEVLQKYGPN